MESSDGVEGGDIREDVIDVARKGEAPLAQIAKDFGLSVMRLRRWIAMDALKKTGVSPVAEESAAIRELKKCNRLLEQENEILRRAVAYLASKRMKTRYSGYAACRASGRYSLRNAARTGS